jgi:protein-disulfide isomerase
MQFYKIWSPLTVAISVLFASSCTAQAEDFSKEEIESIVHEYIMENPEIIADAIYLLQERAEADKAKQASEALQNMQDALTNSELDPVGGNTEGSITIVEFFDYNCGYCKRASGTLQQLVKDNPNLKVVYKEWPILSESSSIAAKIALAINLAEPTKYEEFHHTLLSARSIRSAEDVWKIAEQVGIDRSAAEAKLNSPEVEQHLTQTSALAQNLGITGTPAFIVGDKILKGAYPIEQIQEAIDSQS